MASDMRSYSSALVDYTTKQMDEAVQQKVAPESPKKSSDNSKVSLHHKLPLPLTELSLFPQGDGGATRPSQLSGQKDPQDQSENLTIDAPASARWL
jgi:hypothetical protein